MGFVHVKILLLLLILIHLTFGQWIFGFGGVYMCMVYAHCMQKPEVGIECPAVPGSALLPWIMVCHWGWSQAAGQKAQVILQAHPPSIVLGSQASTGPCLYMKAETRTHILMIASKALLTTEPSLSPLNKLLQTVSHSCLKSVHHFGNTFCSPRLSVPSLFQHWNLPFL